MKETAIKFGNALDRDDFEAPKALLSDECQYSVGEQLLQGPDDIVHSYEKNMLEGRKKLDELEWGTSRVEEAEPGSWFVHFTDHLTHKGVKHTFRCKQKLTANSSGQIVRIEHIENQEERDKLNAFYRRVGL